jgi:hypothetical protein
MNAAVSITPAGARTASAAPRKATVVEQGLLICGFAAALHYAAMLVVVPMFWPAYSSTVQTVSELSAIGAPSRDLWVPLGRIWTVLYVAFGVGVWLAAGRNRILRTVATLIVLSALFGIAWPPMHRREVLAAGGGTSTDSLHLVWAAINGLLMLLAMGLGAVTLSWRFRRASIALMIVVVSTGAITAKLGSRLDDGLPTPWLGVWERIGIGAWLLWVMVLATALLWRELHLVQPGKVGQA